MSRWPITRSEAPDTVGEDPPAPRSYWFPLVLVLLACAGYLWYRRQQRTSAGRFSLESLRPRQERGAVRLSTDDLPPSQEFLSNNASTDSLPQGVELPTVNPQAYSRQQDRNDQQPPSYPSTGLSAPSSLPKPKPVSKAPSRNMFGRRSRRHEGPVEGDDDDEDDSQSSSESEGGVKSPGVGAGNEAGAIFGICDEPDSPTRSGR